MKENRIEESYGSLADTAAAIDVSDGDGIEIGEILPSFEGSVGEISDGDDGLTVGEVKAEEADVTVEAKGLSEREEYEELIKTRFKELYAEDAQRLINRRFRKYKIMEERFKIMEETLAKREAELSQSAERLAELESRLRSEVERAVRETEERVVGEIRAKRLRPSENGALPSRSASPFDVKTLSRDERARLAKRAARGERIKF